jgi:hypothetical protein
MKELSRFPVRRFYGQMMQTTMAGMESTRDIQERILQTSGYTGRRVLGYKLPEWQRLEVWSDEQCSRFVRSIWMGVGLGAFMVNFSKSGKNDDTHLVLLDGQQRLRSIERYWVGEIAVTGEDGRPYHWHQLTADDKSNFMRIPFPWICTEYGTDGELREAYNLHNFGGTSHLASEMA